MDTRASFQHAAQAYAAGVRGLLAPPSAVLGAEASAPLSFDDLAAQAERLAPLSTNFTSAAALQLRDADSDVRIQTSIALLAKASTDLEISLFLLQAAQAEDAPQAAVLGVSAERRAAELQLTEPQLQLLQGLLDTPIRRAVRSPSSLDDARAALIAAIDDALTAITEKATEAGQVALSGLVGMSAAELANAIAQVSAGAFVALDQVTKVSRLYNLFRDFVLRFYESLRTLLGDTVLEVAVRIAGQWVGELTDGELFGALMNRLYDTEYVRNELQAYVEDSRASMQDYEAALKAVERMDDAYKAEVDLAAKILPVVRLLAPLPAAVLPGSQVLLASVFLILGSYVVLSGADYIDSPRLTVLDRTPGVRDVVAFHLASE
jgi:hypothetical protein